MRQLEERLGYRLFLRRARGVELSAEGQRLAQTVAEAYGNIEAELLRLDAGEIRGTLRLRSIPSFLAKWLTLACPASSSATRTSNCAWWPRTATKP